MCVKHLGMYGHINDFLTNRRLCAFILPPDQNVIFQAPIFRSHLGFSGMHPYAVHGLSTKDTRSGTKLS